MQAGDQVAFELVGERRLVAQVIKSADPGQYPPLNPAQRQKAAHDRSARRNWLTLPGLLIDPPWKCKKQR